MKWIAQILVTAVTAYASTKAFPTESMGEAILQGVVIGLAVHWAWPLLVGSR